MATILDLPVTPDVVNAVAIMCLGIPTLYYLLKKIANKERIIE